MRKIKMQHSDLIVSDPEYWVCYIHPNENMITLCSLPIEDTDFPDTTEPVNCPDCLAIIRECKSLEIPGMTESDGYTETSRQFAHDHDIMTTMLTE